MNLAVITLAWRLRLLFLWLASTLNMEAMCSSETSDSPRSTRYNPEDRIRQCILVLIGSFHFNCTPLKAPKHDE
jgi:hypothetical protein